MFYWFLYDPVTRALQSAVADHVGNPDEFGERNAMAWIKVAQDPAEKFLAAWHRAGIELCDSERGIGSKAFRREAIKANEQTDRSIPQRIFNLTPDLSAVAQIRNRLTAKEPPALLRLSNLPADFQALVALGKGRRMVLTDRARSIAEVHE